MKEGAVPFDGNILSKPGLIFKDMVDRFEQAN